MHTTTSSVCGSDPMLRMADIRRPPVRAASVANAAHRSRAWRRPVARTTGSACATGPSGLAVMWRGWTCATISAPRKGCAGIPLIQVKEMPMRRCWSHARRLQRFGNSAAVRHAPSPTGLAILRKKEKAGDRDRAISADERAPESLQGRHPDWPGGARLGWHFRDGQVQWRPGAAQRGGRPAELGFGLTLAPRDRSKKRSLRKEWQ